MAGLINGLSKYSDEELAPPAVQYGPVNLPPGEEMAPDHAEAGHIGHALELLARTFSRDPGSDLPKEATKQTDPYAGQSVGVDRDFQPAAELGGGAWGDKRIASRGQVDTFEKGSHELWEAALAMAALSAPPGAGRVMKAMDITENAQVLRQKYNMPWRDAIKEAGGDAAKLRPEAVIPNEQTPGGVTGLTTGNMTGRQFYDAANWKDPVTGGDTLYQAAGLPSRPGADVVGAYKNDAGAMEHNPATASRTTGTGMSGDPYAFSPRAQNTMNTVETVRATTDMQEGQGWHSVQTTGVGDAAKNSLKVTGLNGRVPTQAEMARLAEIGDKEGLILANSPDGVVFLNEAQPGPSNKSNRRSGGAMERELQGGLRDRIQNAFPGAKIERGRNIGGYNYIADDINKNVAGQGNATRNMVTALQELQKTNPTEYFKLITNPAVAAKAEANIQRLINSGQQGARPDYEEFLNLVSGGGLEGLMKRVGKVGYAGLPVAAGFLGSGGASEDEDGSSRKAR